MQKLSETVYSSLFWLISGLLVWLVIVPVTFICFPVIILVKAAGQVLFQIPQSNLLEAEIRSPIKPESQSTNPVKPLVITLLLKTLIEVPALLAAVISLQPKRLIKAEHVLTQIPQPQPPKAQGELSSEAIDVPVEKKTSGT